MLGFAEPAASTIIGTNSSMGSTASRTARPARVPRERCDLVEIAQQVFDSVDQKILISEAAIVLWTTRGLEERVPRDGAESSGSPCQIWP